MTGRQIAAIVREADELLAADPEHFDAPRYNQPPGSAVAEARDWLGNEAPWHHVAHLPQAIANEEEALAST